MQRIPLHVAYLDRQGITINCVRLRKLMLCMDLRVIYQKLGTKDQVDPFVDSSAWWILEQSRW